MSGLDDLKHQRNELEKYLIEKYPIFVYLFQIAIVFVLIWTVSEMTRQDYKSRTICSFFYEKLPQIGECKQPVFTCADPDKLPQYNLLKNLTNNNIPLPGATPPP